MYQSQWNKCSVLDWAKRKHFPHPGLVGSHVPHRHLLREECGLSVTSVVPWVSCTGWCGADRGALSPGDFRDFRNSPDCVVPTPAVFACRSSKNSGPGVPVTGHPGRAMSKWSRLTRLRNRSWDDSGPIWQRSITGILGQWLARRYGV